MNFFIPGSFSGTGMFLVTVEQSADDSLCQSSVSLSSFSNITRFLRDCDHKMTPAQIYFIRLNKTPTVGRPVAVSHSYITWPISIFVDELLTIKIHMPSVLGNSTELIQFIKNTGSISVQFLSCYRGFISFYPDVDIKKALVAPDLLLRKTHVFVIPLQN